MTNNMLSTRLGMVDIAAILPGMRHFNVLGMGGMS